MEMQNFFQPTSQMFHVQFPIGLSLFAPSPAVFRGDQTIVNVNPE